MSNLRDLASTLFRSLIVLQVRTQIINTLRAIVSIHLNAIHILTVLSILSINELSSLYVRKFSLAMTEHSNRSIIVKSLIFHLYILLD